jgi:hypothetical protein
MRPFALEIAAPGHRRIANQTVSRHPEFFRGLLDLGSFVRRLDIA